MAVLEFTDKNCGGVSVRNEFGQRTPYKRPEHGRPTLDLPPQHVEALRNVPGVQVLRHSGRGYTIPADWLPSAEELFRQRRINNNG